MSVTDFECAIAKSQIGRYIAGDNLPTEIARQLESHIDNCPRCKQLLQDKKNSLEAMIVDNETSGTRTTLNVRPDSIPMTSGSSALKPDYMEVLADNARMSLREKLKDSSRIKTEVVEVPTIAPAFAYKDATTTETVQLTVGTSEKPAKKKGLGLSAFALFREVPDEATKPALSVDNIRSAKAVFRNSNESLRKPLMYLGGLCAVVGAMSYVLRDPTSLFGNRAAVVTPITKKSTVNVAKVLPHKPVQIKDKGVDAQGFATDPIVTKPKVVHKPKMLAKPILTKAPKVAQTEAATKKVIRQSAKKAQAQRFAVMPKAKKANRTKIHSTKKQEHSPSSEGVVKLYPTDPTPTNKEQN